MIVLFTDYGRSGPYTALVEAAVLQVAPGTPIINLLADAPAFNISAASHLLAAFADQFPVGTVFIAVIDPGVGGGREPVVVEADGRWFVGPHNGLFDVILTRSNQVSMHEIATESFTLSDSFHGRDLFAPVAALVATRQKWPSMKRLKAVPFGGVAATGLAEIIYIDDFGNAFTGVSMTSLSRNARILVSGQELSFAQTFSAVQKGRLFWYGNSIGLVEIAANQASAAQLLGLQVGSSITMMQS